LRDIVINLYEYLQTVNLGAKGIADAWTSAQCVSVNVLGDPIIDAYTYVEPLGMSKGYPVINWQITDEVNYLGGAAKVALDCAHQCSRVTLGAPTPAVDAARCIPSEMLFHDSTCLCDPWVTKRRICIDKQVLFRTTEGRAISYPHPATMPSATVTILSLFQGEFNIPKAEVRRLAGDGLLVVDCQNPETIKLYRNIDAVLFATEKELRDSGVARSSFKEVFLKNGPNGSMVDANFLPAFNRDPVDTIGSGDAYLAAAAIMLGYSRGMYHTAAIIGSIAAAIQCTKFGNGTVTRDEIDEVLNGVIELQRT